MKIFGPAWKVVTGELSLGLNQPPKMKPTPTGKMEFGSRTESTTFIDTIKPPSWDEVERAHTRAAHHSPINEMSLGIHVLDKFWFMVSLCYPLGRFGRSKGRREKGETTNARSNESPTNKDRTSSALIVIVVECWWWILWLSKAGYTAQDAPRTRLKIARDRRTDGQTHTTSHREATAHLKITWDLRTDRRIDRTSKRDA